MIDKLNIVTDYMHSAETVSIKVMAKVAVDMKTRLIMASLIFWNVWLFRGLKRVPLYKLPKSLIL